MSWLRLAAVVWLSAAGPTGGVLGGQPPLTAETRQIYTLDGEKAMRLPTDVAVASDGMVYVADGVQDRVLIFSSNGLLRDEISDIGSRPLSRPIGLAIDAADNIWIADTGHARIVGRKADGSLLREVSISAAPDTQPPDITDVLIEPDSGIVWLVDNDHHRLGRLAAGGEHPTWLGKFGDSLGEFRYPYLIARSPAGDVFVSDALNGRVEVFGRDGQPIGSIGTYGVEPGTLYRPKGVAVDHAGRVWVADGPLGVVQVFDQRGALIDILRNRDGSVLRFETPAGMAFDRQGDLYVVEVLANRVRRLAITIDAQALAAAAPMRRVATPTPQPRTCTACHMDWMEPFASGQGTELHAVPESTSQQPYSSTERSCVSCHDGTVIDSRRKVWVMQSHRSGIVPPADMSVSERLPLVRGRIVCRTCHTAHTRGGAGESISTAVFLRVKSRPSELCMGCHEPLGLGPQAGMHPLKKMDEPIPQELVDAGAQPGEDPSAMTCMFCHEAHGSSDKLLLVVKADRNELCIACHDQMRPGRFREPDQELPHPLRPTLNSDQLAAAESAHRPIGPGDTLICSTCHAMHHAANKRYLLAFDLKGSEMCLKCHSEKVSLLDSPHDLRLNYPEERNSLGMSPAQTGPCSSCHLFHDYAREPEPGPLDAAGECLACHRVGGLAVKKIVGPHNHPEANCTECHDPHLGQQRGYMRERTQHLCTRCHTDKVIAGASPHNPANAIDAWPGVSRWTDVPCLACHRPHGDAKSGLFRAGLAKGFARDDAACIACHSDAAWNSAHQRSAMHPRDPGDAALPDDLPLVSTAVGAEPSQIGCKTCHNPHQSSGEHLLRTAAGASDESLCLRCHTNQQPITHTGHTPELLARAGLETNACQPCHNVHANPELLADKLWPKKLIAPPPPPSKLPAVVGGHCLGCHKPDGPAPAPAVATHPDVAMFSPPGVAGSPINLFDTRGQLDPTGHLTCRTCHMPHGRPGAVADAKAVGAPPTLAAKVAGTMLRPFVAPNLCTTCHGADGLRRFLYFHDPQRRSGPLQAVAD